MEEGQDLIYEESQVLWAKIRGYPWWPAYVSEVHFGQTPSDYEYTVIFFGDNTNSRLGPSKLRKFPEFYSECYAKTKTNKKLKQSIEKAQQRLKQNNQDVSMYQSIRNEMRVFKKRKGNISQSRLSSSEKAEENQPLQLVKHKTEPPVKGSKLRNAKQKSQIFDQSQSQKQQSQKSIKSNSKSPNKPATQFNRRRSQTIKLNAKMSPGKRIEGSQSQQQLPSKRSRRGFRKAKQVSEELSDQKQKGNSRSKQKIQDESEQSRKQEKEQNVQEEQQSKQKEITVRPQVRRGRRGRKGRPPKSEQLLREKEKQKLEKQQADEKEKEKQVEMESEKQQQQKQPSPPKRQQQVSKRGRKKIIHNNKMPLKSAQNESVPHREDGTLTEAQAQKIRKSLSNRKQLVRVLLEMPINAGNIKQILDLGVSLVLQDGPITKNVYLLLCTLKATLLHKYFPDDNKHRRKYEKMTKEKKKIIMHEDFSDHDQNANSEHQGQQKMQDEKLIDEKTHQKSEEKSNLAHHRKKDKDRQKQRQKETKIKQDYEKLKQIRMKANLKLEKMIRKAGLEQGAKQFALRIENTFQETANAKGDMYRTIAYQRMRNIKTRLAQLSEKKVNSHEIKSYLQQILRAYEAEASSSKDLY